MAHATLSFTRTVVADKQTLDPIINGEDGFTQEKNIEKKSERERARARGGELFYLYIFIF